MIKFFIYTFISTFFISNIIFAKTEYFQAGINLYNMSKYEDAKFKFEQDLVLNPKMNFLIYICQKFLIS